MAVSGQASRAVAKGKLYRERYSEGEAVKVKTQTFNGIRYDIDICGPIAGSCDQPRGGRPSLRIACDLNTKKGLITVIHECIHASDWPMSEEKVDRLSNDAGTLLWRLGYRRTGDD